ncbi:MAG: hypothetical protein ACREMV_01105 [Gemmatimonadales bacterium]
MNSVDAQSVPTSREGRVAEAMRRSLPLLPAEVRGAVEALLSPQSLAIITATLAVWAASHFFGVGEIVDIILLVAGVVILGKAVWDVAEALWAFADRALHAKTDQDLDEAARHFARAVTIGGVDLIAALLLRRSARSVKARVGARGLPPVRAPRLMDVGPPPASGGRLFYRPTISRPTRLPGGLRGQTDWYGDIAVVRTQTLAEQRITLYHEWVHSILSPRLVILRRLRASLRASAYWRSALLRYLEEALSESYGQLRVRGLTHVWKGVAFPIGVPGEAYVTVAEMVAEGAAIGTIVLGGHLFRVHWLTHRPDVGGR